MNKKQTLRDKYLDCRSADQRIEILDRMRSAGESLPLSIVKDVMVLDITLREQVALVSSVNSSNSLDLEKFLLGLLPDSHQDIAVTALERWASSTDRLLWYKLLDIAYAAQIPQRLRYRMIEVIPRAGGKHMLDAYINIDGLEDFSPAFHGILIQRAMQWNFEHKRIKDLAVATLEGLFKAEQVGDKDLPNAICYLARFAPDEIDRVKNSEHTSETWRPILKSILTNTKLTKKEISEIGDFLTKPLGKDFDSKFLAIWPGVWLRGQLDSPTITTAISTIATYMRKNSITSYERYPMNWQAFAGIPHTTLVESLSAIEDDITFVDALNLLEHLIPPRLTKPLTEELIKRVKVTEDPNGFMQELNAMTRSFLLSKNLPESHWGEIKNEEQATIKKRTGAKANKEFDLEIKDYPSSSTPADWEEDVDEVSDRKLFFDLTYRNQSAIAPSANDTFWQSLIHAWQDPSADNLHLATDRARKAPAFFQVCFLHTLGQFKGNDEAALKLLDYIRTTEHQELRAIIHALNGIGTSRCTQELVSSITRPNTPIPLQMEICALLDSLDLSGVQNELRSAISDLHPGPDTGNPRWDVRESLTALLTTHDDNDEVDDSPQTSEGPNKANLDDILRTKIPPYEAMSSEVRRALRTAQFFHDQVNASRSQSSIDLSPVIDMQYKAMELTFRELFEEPCKQLIHQGLLQRRLDVIGYARPIEQQMTQFENYVGSLPIINTIPFFSKFKLRKMLRAICQFRPGRRFTLDGLKAFGLFFLCFGRHEDRYGLNGAFKLPFETDEELFEFCKKLHMFQDFRNRAAHEGFQPDASNDIDAIWTLTGEISRAAYELNEFLQSSPVSNGQEQAVQGYKKAEGVEIVHKKVS